jgi:hypothetical protein
VHHRSLSLIITHNGRPRFLKKFPQKIVRKLYVTIVLYCFLP